MRLLGVKLSGWGLPFVSATARHGPDGSEGEIVCETQEQCDAVRARATREGWFVATRVATEDEVWAARRWSEVEAQRLGR